MSRGLYEQQVERDVRQVILPAMVTLYLSRALGATTPVPTESLEHSEPARDWVSGQSIDGLKDCPPLTSAALIYNQASKKLEDKRLVTEEILTPYQSIHNRKAGGDLVGDFTASYPTIALGYLYEAIHAGDRPKPRTGNEMIALACSKDFNGALLQGMSGASGQWRQSSHTAPWDIFNSFGDLYDYGKESPFEYDKNGVAILKRPIVKYLHQSMKERNDKSIGGAAVGCPIITNTIHNISQDPYSPRYLSKEQIAELTSPRDDGEPLATQDKSGVIRIKFDAITALQSYFTSYAHNYLGMFKMPVLLGVSEYANKHSKGLARGAIAIGHIDPEAVMQPAAEMLPA